MDVIFKASLLERGKGKSRRVQVIKYKSGKFAITSFRGNVAERRIELADKRATLQLAIQRVQEWEKLI